MTQYEMICELEDIADKLIDGETNAQYDDEGLETLQTIKYLIGKYNEINDNREV